MKHILPIIVAALAVSCGGTSESPTSPSANPGTPLLDPTQMYDSHPVPPVDPAPDADPAPPSPPPEEPAPPAAPTFDGTYTGSATGTGRFRISPTVTGEVITGILSTPADAEFQGTIPLSGTASAAGAVTMTATDSCGGQVYTLTGSIAVDAAGAATMTGTWSQPAAANCSGARSGTWTAARTPPTSTFNGIYTGAADGKDPLTLTVANGVVSFTVGSGGPIPGTVSSAGAIAANGGQCHALLSGQITLTASGVATATGTWSHPTTPECGTGNSGTWTAIR